jgi:hypothetical protein
MSLHDDAIERDVRQLTSIWDDKCYADCPSPIQVTDFIQMAREDGLFIPGSPTCVDFGRQRNKNTASLLHDDLQCPRERSTPETMRCKFHTIIMHGDVQCRCKRKVAGESHGPLGMHFCDMHIYF